MNSNNPGWRLCVLVILAFTFPLTSLAQKRGYKYDPSGNITAVIDVSNDVLNCGNVGTTCPPGQSCFDEVCCGVAPCNNVCCTASQTACFNNACCSPQVCNQWAACGTADNTCGGTATCAGSCLANQQCAGNQCFANAPASYSKENNATGEMSIIAGPYDVEVLGQFVSSKAGYAAAMTLSPTPLVPSACTIQGSNPNCLMDTLQCANCPTDPNAQPGELSCWCKNPKPLTYKNIPANQSLSFASQLLIDKDRDTRPDEIRTSRSRIGPPNISGATGITEGNKRGFVRYYEIIKNVFRYEWEDQQKPPNGDYNDYVGQLSFKDCDKTPYPPDIATWDDTGLICKSDCADRKCLAGESRPAEFRIASTVMVDTAATEADREKRGKLLTLSVLVQSQLAQDIAICPVLHFKYENPGNVLWDCNSKFAPDYIQEQEYTSKPSSPCTPGAIIPGANGYEPVCTNDKKQACGTFPVSVSREQWYLANRCMVSGPNGRVGISDVVHMGGATACGSDSQIVDFQLALKDVDAQITAPNQSLEKRAAGILFNRDQALEKIDFYIFTGIPRKTAFHCPSGVNVDLTGFADTASPIKVRKYTVYNKVTGQTSVPQLLFNRHVR
jgi:hypothetical protein